MKILKQIITYSFIGIGIGSLMNYFIAIFFFPNSNPLGVPSFVQLFYQFHRQQQSNFSFLLF